MPKYRLVATTRGQRLESLHDTVEDAKRAFDWEKHDPTDLGQIWLEDGQHRKLVSRWWSPGFGDVLEWREVHRSHDLALSIKAMLFVLEISALATPFVLFAPRGARLAVAALFGVGFLLSFVVRCYIAWHVEKYGSGNPTMPFEGLSLLGPATIWLLLSPSVGSGRLVVLSIIAMAAHFLLPTAVGHTAVRALDSGDKGQR